MTLSGIIILYSVVSSLSGAQLNSRGLVTTEYEQVPTSVGNDLVLTVQVYSVMYLPTYLDLTCILRTRHTPQPTVKYMDDRVWTVCYFYAFKLKKTCK
jgi:hypothetical protein